MKSINSSIRINSNRLFHNFETLAKIGNTFDGGVNRPAFSEEHIEARRLFRNLSNASGFEFQIDQAGNQTALLKCGSPNAPSLLLGSHLDSVPFGGRFDGALGVLSALEVLQTIQENNIRLPINLEAVDFTDEEGFHIGLLGSTAFCGKLKSESLLSARGGYDALIVGLKLAGLTEKGLISSCRDPKTIAGYLELHIEQGNKLHNSHANIGVVSTIVGIISLKVIFIGQANHAGTTPMHSRLDAALGASAFTLAVRELVIKYFPDCVVNVSAIDLEPGVFNTIPARATVSLEYRGPGKDLRSLDKEIKNKSIESAKRFGLKSGIEHLGEIPPVPMDTNIQILITKSADNLDLRSYSLQSGAGHDAQSFADICPTGMIFVPSVGGISHSPEEFTKWQDCINGANVLLQTALAFASSINTPGQ